MVRNITTALSIAKRRSPRQDRAKQSELERARQRGDLAREHEVLVELVAAEPKEPRWPHKLGDALRRMGRGDDAAAAYLRAAELYASGGFGRRAEAMRIVVDCQRAANARASQRGWLT